MTHYDLAVIGTGSANSIVTRAIADRRVAIIERGKFGGTCINVGCIPTKMFVYAADVARTVRDSARFGIDAHVDGVRWPDIRDRIFARTDEVSESGLDYRVNGANTTVYLGDATFTGPRRLVVDVDGVAHEVTADQVVLAAGGRPVVPEVLHGVPHHTSDTVMRIDELPRRMAIVGGGYVAAEFAHVFSALGVAVTQVARSPRLLRHLDSDLSSRFTALAADKWDVRLAADVVAAGRQPGGGVRLEVKHGEPVEADLLLVATGRRPNTDGLGAEAGGIELHEDGRVRVDRHGRTSAAGVWGMGDVSSEYQLKHVANHEARVLRHNLLHPEDLWSYDHRFVPAGIFTDPQIATVGLTEDEALAQGVPYTAYTQRYGDVAYGWAMEDEHGICKLLADPRTGQLLGAHLMGPMATSLIQPLVQAMHFGQDGYAVARGQHWIHPALAEVVENALLGLDLPR